MNHSNLYNIKLSLDFRNHWYTLPQTFRENSLQYNLWNNKNNNATIEEDYDYDYSYDYESETSEYVKYLQFDMGNKLRTNNEFSGGVKFRPFSIDTVISFGDTERENTILAKNNSTTGNGNHEHWHLAITGDNHLRFMFRNNLNDGNISKNFAASYNFNADEFYHINVSKVNSELRMYVNGLCIGYFKDVDDKISNYRDDTNDNAFVVGGISYAANRSTDFQGLLKYVNYSIGSVTHDRSFTDLGYYLSTYISGNQVPLNPTQYYTDDGEFDTGNESRVWENTATITEDGLVFDNSYLKTTTPLPNFNDFTIELNVSNLENTSGVILDMSRNNNPFQLLYDVVPNPDIIVTPNVKLLNETTAALNFENSIIDDIPTTLWNVTGATSVVENGIYELGSSLKTSALGDSLYTSNTILTGGNTPFTIEFYAIISGRAGAQTSELILAPLFSKNNSGVLANQQLHVNLATGKVDILRQAGSGGSAIEVSGSTNIKLNEIYKFTYTYDGSAIRLFVNDKLDIVVGTNNGFVSGTSAPFTFLHSPVPSYPSYSTSTAGLLDNVNIHDNIATITREYDPHEEYLVIDLPFDGENNSTKIVDNGTRDTTDIDKLTNYLPLKFNSKSSIGDNWNLVGNIDYTTRTSALVNPSNYLYLDDVDLSSEPFTIEFFTTATQGNSSGYSSPILQWGTANDATDGFAIEDYLTTNTIRYRTAYGSMDVIKSNTVVGTEYHIAIVYDGDTFKIFVDGIGTNLSLPNNFTTPKRLHIGKGYGSWYESKNKLISEFKFYKGFAKYTSNFARPFSNRWSLRGAAKLSTAQKFDGFSSLNLTSSNANYIEADKFSDFTITNTSKFTIDFSYYTSAETSSPTLVYFYYDAWSYFNINISVTGNFQVAVNGTVYISQTVANLSGSGVIKCRLTYDNTVIKLYVNNALLTSYYVSINLPYGTSLQIGSSGTSNDVYIKNFKMYKGVAIAPVSKVGKIQLDFDDNFVDNYRNSTWTNNGLIFNKPNSASGSAVYSSGSNSVFSANASTNYNKQSFEIDFMLTLHYPYTVLISNRYVYVCIKSDGAIYYDFLNDGSYIGGYSLNNTGITINQYYNLKIYFDRGLVYTYLNNTLIEVTENLIQNYETNLLRLSGSVNDSNYLNGYIDSFKAIKNFTNQIIVDKPVINFPLENNYINTGYKNLTVTKFSQYSPNFTVVADKPCAFFNGGSGLLRIEKSEILDVDYTTDFIIEFDFIANSFRSENILFSNTDYYWSGYSFWLQVRYGTLRMQIYGSELDTDISIQTDIHYNVKLFRYNQNFGIIVNDVYYNFNYSARVDLSYSYLYIGGLNWYPSGNFVGGISNFKIFVGTSTIPETYSSKKILDLDFKPTNGSYLFQDNFKNCVIHPINITKRDYIDGQYACKFNGTNQYFNIGKNPSLNFGTDNFVIEFEYFLESYNTSKDICIIENASLDQNYRAYVALCRTTNIDSNKIQFGVTTSNGEYVTVSSNSQYPINAKTKITILRNVNKIYIYINGVLDKQLQLYIPVVDFNFNGNTLIGKNSATSDYFSGILYRISVLRNTNDLSLFLNGVSPFLSKEVKLIVNDVNFAISLPKIAQPDSFLVKIIKNYYSNTVTLKVDSKTDLKSLGYSNMFNSVGVPTIGNNHELNSPINATIKDIKMYNIYSTDGDYEFDPLYSNVLEGEVPNFELLDSETVYLSHSEDDSWGDFVIEGFIEGVGEFNQNQDWVIYNTYTKSIIDWGKFSYYRFNGINPKYKYRYVIKNKILGTEYPLPELPMVEGEISGELKSTNCDEGEFVIRIYTHLTHRYIGEYSVIYYEYDGELTGKYSVPNLDVNVMYDVMLVDINYKYETKISSKRYPIEIVQNTTPW